MLAQWLKCTSNNRYSTVDGLISLVKGLRRRKFWTHRPQDRKSECLRGGGEGCIVTHILNPYTFKAGPADASLDWGRGAHFPSWTDPPTPIVPFIETIFGNSFVFFEGGGARHVSRLSINADPCSSLARSLVLPAMPGAEFRTRPEKKKALCSFNCS